MKKASWIVLTVAAVAFILISLVSAIHAYNKSDDYGIGGTRVSRVAAERETPGVHRAECGRVLQVHDHTDVSGVGGVVGNGWRPKPPSSRAQPRATTKTSEPGGVFAPRGS